VNIIAAYDSSNSLIRQQVAFEAYMQADMSFYQSDETACCSESPCYDRHWL